MDTTTTPAEPTLREILEQRLTAAEAAREKDRAAVEAKHAAVIGKLEIQLAAEDEIGVLELRRIRKAAAAAAKAKATPEPPPGAGSSETGTAETPPGELQDDPLPVRPQDIRTQEVALAGLGDCRTRAEVEAFVHDLPRDIREAVKLQTVELLNQLRAKA